MKEIIPDDTILKKIKLLLPKRGLGDPNKIHVHVKKGIVTLSGEVTAFFLKSKAKATVNEVDGVVDCVVQLTIAENKKEEDEEAPPAAGGH